MISRADRERGERLRKFCADVEGKPVVWGSDDCSMWPAMWAVSESGREANWPVYDSKEGAHAVVEKEGGLAEVWARLAFELRLEECFEPILPVGSIAVVNLDYAGHRQIGCIFAFGNVGSFRTDVGRRTWGVRSRSIVRAWAMP